MMIIMVKIHEIEKHSGAKFKIQGEIQTKIVLLVYLQLVIDFEKYCMFITQFIL